MAATQKTLTPTNEVISIPAFADKPDYRLPIDSTGKLADAINELDDKLTRRTAVDTSMTISHSASTGTISLYRFGRLRILVFNDISLSSDITLTNFADNDKPIKNTETVLCNYASNKIARVWIRENSNSIGVAPSDTAVLYTGQLVYISKA